LRARLVDNRGTAPLFDSARYTRDLEALYRRMWAKYCGSPDKVAGDRTPIEVLD
jgi:hypothetical protein